MADEGAGATLTFGTSGLSLDLVSIQASGVTRESIPTFHHGTSASTVTGSGTGFYKTYQPGDFTDPGTIEISFLYNPNEKSTVTGYGWPIPIGSAETITITYPVPSGDNNGATEASQGFVTDFSGPELAIDSVMTASATIKRSGVITFTTSSS